MNLLRHPLIAVIVPYLFITLFSSITMLSASVRAFTAMTAKKATTTAAMASSTTTSRQFISLAQGKGIAAANYNKNIGSFLLRSSSTSDGPDTSIVDVCSQKISDALETTDVKVTGMYPNWCVGFPPRFYIF